MKILNARARLFPALVWERDEPCDRISHFASQADSIDRQLPETCEWHQYLEKKEAIAND
jgi:hypothetical protein